MKIFFDLDTVFFMIGAGTSCIVPLLILTGFILYGIARFKVVKRGD